MVELVFMFEVPKEKQEEFLNFVKTGTKPYWESHGCLGYNVWQALGRWFKSSRCHLFLASVNP